MRILLVGEYSGVQENLKKTFIKKGHSVFLIHDGDSYKKFNGNDFSVTYNRLNFKSKVINKFFSLLYFFLDFLGIKGIIQCFRYKKDLSELKDFDIVQIVNTKPFGQFGAFANYYLLSWIFKNNKKIYLCALGDDYTWVKSCLDRNPPYSMFDNLKLKNIKSYLYSLTYIYGVGAKFIDNYVFNNIQNTIPGLYDYYFAYKKTGRSCTEVIPIAYELENKINIRDISYPIKIFHGWQTGKELRKGNIIFDNVIKKLEKKYPGLIDYSVVKNVPYTEYIKLFNNSDIVIDQCFSMDRGVNALIGMVHGKVVFSGCDILTKEYYANGIENCLVNAIPVEDEIFKQLEFLILNKEKIIEIQVKAKQYMEKFHSYEYVYEKYRELWSL